MTRARPGRAERRTREARRTRAAQEGRQRRRRRAGAGKRARFARSKGGLCPPFGTPLDESRGRSCSTDKSPAGRARLRSFELEGAAPDAVGLGDADQVTVEDGEGDDVGGRGGEPVIEGGPARAGVGADVDAGGCSRGAGARGVGFARVAEQHVDRLARWQAVAGQAPVHAVGAGVKDPVRRAGEDRSVHGRDREHVARGGERVQHPVDATVAALPDTGDRHAVHGAADAGEVGDRLVLRQAARRRSEARAAVRGAEQPARDPGIL